MSTPQEVACSFITAYFETLASNPAELVDMYSQQSSLTVVDFDYGISEASGLQVPDAVEQWAQIFQGCQLSVDNFTAAPLHGGVNVYVSVTATNDVMKNYFQFVVALEACNVLAYGAETYFIRNHVAIRTGAVLVEQPVEEPMEEPAPEPVQEAVQLPDVKPAPEPEPEPAAAPTNGTRAAATAAAAAAATATTVAAAAAAETGLKPKAPQPAKPKTWASLASAAPSRVEQRQPLKVIAPENGTRAEAARPQEPQEPKEPQAKPHAKAPRPPLPPIGDRLMFNIDHAVTDEEIRTALGSYAPHIVSLRNNSGNGRVFLDFAAGEKVMDDLKANPPVVGARKARVNLYRQKARE